MQPMTLDDATIGIIGLGYVGLPLAVAFAGSHDVIGFDLDKIRIAELSKHYDATCEVSASDLQEARPRLKLTSNDADLSSCSVFIITVPTPIDHAKQPDLSHLIEASETVGRVMQKGAVVIYESTVFPGTTEDVCVPVLEMTSGLTFLSDFHCGYSPERINPGDKNRCLTSIKKVTSGSSPKVADAIDTLYASIISAGTHKAPSIKVAEAAKVIENTQRDLNIALMNELAIIFDRLGIDTHETLEAAGTKWNFLHFKPGLVGGHCVGVDPYYLTHKAQTLGYHPEVVLAGRRINDGMGIYVADRVAKLMLKHEINPLQSRVLILGLAFKENCTDARNSRVVDIIEHLSEYHMDVDVFDPLINADAARNAYGIECLEQQPDNGLYDAVVIAVPHREFVELGAEHIRRFGKSRSIIFDVKGMLPKDAVEGRL